MSVLIQELTNEFQSLVNTKVCSDEDLKAFLIKASSQFDHVDEILMSSYIRYQLNTGDKSIQDSYQFTQKMIKPLYKNHKMKIERKLYTYENYFSLSYYQYLFKRIQNSMLLISEDNLQLQVAEDELVTKYFDIRSNMTTTWKGQTMPVLDLYGMLYDDNRDIREEALKHLSVVYKTKEEEFQLIMDRMIHLRDQKAKNAGFKNYRDYMFSYYERLDYTSSECHHLADSVHKHVIPLIDQSNRIKREKLSVEELKPWDTRVTGNEDSLSIPYKTIPEMVQIADHLLRKLSPSFSDLLFDMKEKNLFDLESRDKKAPGGFCEFLPESKSSFIMLNLLNTKDDLPIFLHEMGHAIHHDLMKDIELNQYKSLPMETAELAAMSIELLTLDLWEPLYKTKEEFHLVKKELFEQILEFIPITIAVDQFQHWLYTNPDHTYLERNEKFQSILQQYDSKLINWDGIEEWKKLQWLDVIHIFETPFYYIEYAIAQLGALQLYRNYKNSPSVTISKFKSALTLGSSKSVKEVYQEAGIEFNLSEEMIKELMDFVGEELSNI
ncbi:M3 family oligoendopeptidase [Alkalihalobacillus macyae]|uniref:M3 family oligoendopeptidase n=1 Tax=Guptibacillus hwajinpoensis TaxID=208199 RepID=UPI00273C3F7D|nr:M3 family oligoendopeptidase [Alkalihalobacillus macyae]MDP4550101.1 M3 family oligoendopeptidase [Alkalihalobacillus macyae]